MKFRKILNIFILVFFVAFCSLCCFNLFDQIPLIDNSTNRLQVYELWHIESFEGGGADRQNHLIKLAMEYEKQSPSTLFMVKLIAEDQLQDALSNSTPHLISFSEQVAKTVLPYLTELDCEYGVRDNMLDSSRYNGQLMAIPYIASGYCYFSKTNSNPSALYTANNNAHSATPIIDNIEINNGATLSSYECYTKFVNHSNIKLLGTARDLFRISSLERLGKLSVEYQPIETFTDLIQYIGITCNNSDTLKFIDYLLSDTCQQSLINLSLFSPKHISLYHDENYSLMEKALQKCIIPNIFND